MELIPGEDEYRVRLKLVDHEIVVEKPIEIEIGLQALPNRPQPKDCRRSSGKRDSSGGQPAVRCAWE